MALTGRATGTGSGVKNTSFGVSTEVLRRKQLITGTFDPLKTAIVAEVPFLSISPSFTADQCGFGSMVHRLHLKNDLGAQGVETWIQPQAEAGGAAASAGEIDWTGTTGVVAGTLSLYIAGDRIPVTITTGMTLEEVSDAVVAAVNANSVTNVIAAKTAVTFETTFTSKTKGTWGDEVSIALNLGAGEATPTGITAAITAMTGGSGLPDITTALDALGTGDNANEAHFTALIHGYGQDTTTLDAIETYVGSGNEFVGLFSQTVARPFRSCVGNVEAGSLGLSDLIAVTDLRLEDRSSGVVAVPDSKSHPSEIAAQTMGHAERRNNLSASASVRDITLIGVDPGETANRWTSDRSERNIAVDSGISPTLIVGGNVKLQNFISFYRPASVPADSNGWREFRNFSITQNILASQLGFFSSEKWTDYDIVADVSKVTNSTAKKRARDRDSLLDDVVLLIKAWEGIVWIYGSSFSIDKIKAEPLRVSIRPSGDGFNVTIPVLYPGIGNINDVETEFDVSFAVLTQ